MENDTRLVKAVSYLDNALSSLKVIPLSEFNIKSAKTSVRNARTLIRNTKSDMRIGNIEREIELIKEYILKK